MTAPLCREAGCDVLVAASAIFGAKSRTQYRRIIAELRGGASKPKRRTGARVSKSARRR
jgi:pentose-5-phosphate-3-epimerase